MIKNIISNIRNKKERGFTLVEILVSVGLITILGAAITATVISISTSTSSFTQASMTQSEAAETVSEMTRDISAATKINYASDYRVDLTTQEDNNSFDVSYFYWNPDNPAYVTIPTGVVSSELPDFPAIMQFRKEAGSTAPGKLSVAASGYSVFQQDRTLFIYYDANNSAISPTPINTAILPKIVRVDFGFSLKVEDRPARIELASSATPRYSSTDISPQGEYAAIEACPAPTVLGTTTVTAGTKNVVLNWSIPAGFNSKDFNTYTIYREGRIYGKQKASPMVVGVINSRTTTTYTDTEADWGETYKYYVVLGCTIGTSDPSGQYSVTVPPEQPKFYNINSKQASLTELQTKASGDVISGVTTTNPKVGLQYTVARGLTNQLVWEKVNGALGYYLYHNGTFIQRFGANTTTYQDYGRPYGNIGDYTLIAYNIGSNGTGGNSLTSATARLISPPAKSAFTVTALDTSILSSISDNKIDVTTRASNTTGYKVYKVSTLTAGSTCAYADRAATLDFTGNTKTDAGVNWGTWTCYKLVGYNDAGDGEKSDDLIAKQKPGKFSITSVTGGWHRYYATGDYSANGAIPLPGQAQCWYGGVDEYCDNAPTYASLTLYTNDTSDKTNINIIWSSSTNAYGDYTLNQTRTETGGTVDQAPEHGNVTVTAPYNGTQQSWAFGNQMPGSVYSHTVTAKALSGEARVVSNNYVSNPDIPHYVEVRREERAAYPQFRRSVKVYAGVLRGLADQIFVQLRTNTSPQGPAVANVYLGVNNAYQVAYGTTFSAPYTGGITVKTNLTRLGQFRESLESGMDGLYVNGTCVGSYADYTPIPDTRACYINGAAIRYYSGGYASAGTSQVGNPSQLTDPPGPSKPVNPIPEPQANCGTIYESDPYFTQVYGCKFGTGIPSAPSYAYLKTISGVDGTIAWNSVPYATGYTVKVMAGSTTNTYNFPSSVTQGQVPLIDGVLNIVTVTAKNNVATSVPSPEVLIDMPEVPKNLVIKTVVGKEYTVEWDRPLVEETTSSYKITMVSSGVTTTYDLNKPTTGKPTIKITVPSANPGGTISIQAINPNVGADDNTVATSRPSTKLVLGATEAPANLRLVSLTNQTAKLAWDAPFGAVTYKLTGTYTGPVAQVTNISTISGIATTTYDLTNIPYARTVTLNVQSTNGAGDSIKSNTVTFDVLPPAPTGVTLTSNNALGSTITTPSTLQWTTATCAVGTVQYKLSRVSPNATTIRDWQGTMTPSAYAPYVPTQATGGIITTYTSGNITYRVHRFTASGTFQVTQLGNDKTLDYLIVAGGGGGGFDFGGGGAAGGMVEGTTTVSATSYAVTVGAGGAGAQLNVSSSNGQNSSIFGVTATGGGGGGNGSGASAYGREKNGGSGGGAGGWTSPYTQSVGTGIVGQGNNGGRAQGSSNTAAPGGGGGGGGAGSAGEGAPTTSNRAGNGGSGKISTITGSSVTYAGGGGGGSYSGGIAGTGGSGGGGAGSTGTNTNASSGADELGGGGGGNSGGGGGVAGAGGSGVVIVRYEISNTASAMHAPGTNYQYRIEARCVEGNFTSGVTTANHSFTAVGTTTAAPSAAPTLNTPGTAITAAGGTTGTYTSNGVTYKYHKFTASGTFDITSLGTTKADIDSLIIAGGGGGGSGNGSGYEAGGGGAGGVVQKSFNNMTVGSYAVTVGGGGAVNVNGGNSSFNGVTAIGGGRGAAGYAAASAGGSGGGNSHCSTANGAGTAGQGYAGQKDPNCSNGGGGGGAGEMGGTDGFGHGGDGIVSAIDGTSRWYAGGGAACGAARGATGTGGAGGGGSATCTLNGAAGNGTNGLGGGGGGAYHQTGGGGVGGSGVVIIRYVIKTSEPYAGVAHKVNVTSTGQCTQLHPGATPLYNFYRNGVKFATDATSTSADAAAAGKVGDVVTYEYTVRCRSTYNGVTYTTPESAKSPVLSVTLKAIPTLVTAASGGSTSTYTSGGVTYQVHKFTSSGTFTVSSVSVPNNTDIDYLVVGGGGGGGSQLPGGAGGAGGFLEGSFGVQSTASIAVTIGGGGGQGGDGGSSTVSLPNDTTTAYGGGGGGMWYAWNSASGGRAGASGGGGSTLYGGTMGGGGNAYASQGFGGGNGLAWESGAYVGGGGGGAAGRGGTAIRSKAGNGGSGLISSIDGTSRYYAGGGASSYYYEWGAGVTPGTAGNGGGGNAAVAGTPNTGGGGGSSSASGGSGIVIFRYAVQ